MRNHNIAMVVEHSIFTPQSHCWASQQCHPNELQPQDKLPVYIPFDVQNLRGRSRVSKASVLIESPNHLFGGGIDF
ncbi:MAG: hypothetical protein KDA65_19850, partial [Planctomycetaceae bacterium]|nr:hypothetical protein [Planctomycetaceae bacterium]